MNPVQSLNRMEYNKTMDNTTPRVTKVTRSFILEFMDSLGRALKDGALTRAQRDEVYTLSIAVWGWTDEEVVSLLTEVPRG